MSVSTSSAPRDVQARARQSRGASESTIYTMVAQALATRHQGGGVLLDVGCGTGSLRQVLGRRFDRYVGVDVIRYDDFPADAEFVGVDLDSGSCPLPDGIGDVVASLETIEHLESPRAFVRELTRLARPGGWVIVTTPNQLSFLSKLTLLVKNQFNAFQDSCYPAHLTALLEVDLRRMACECRLRDTAVAYSLRGRMPCTSRHYPGFLSRLWPRAFSDNVLLIGKKSVS